jgi:organic hydroperoxide reductase OsmC/OhrA
MRRVLAHGQSSDVSPSALAASDRPRFGWPPMPCGAILFRRDRLRSVRSSAVRPRAVGPEPTREDRMQELPHHYSVSATAGAEGDVAVEGDRLPAIASAAPAEFGGPGDRWSPETLLVAAVADCFILTFRAVARASKLPWNSLRCEVAGTLDRVERVTQFTGFQVRASLQVPAGTDEEKARRLLARTEQSCLVTNSLKGASHLEAEVEFAAA